MAVTGGWCLEVSWLLMQDILDIDRSISLPQWIQQQCTASAGQIRQPDDIRVESCLQVWHFLQPSGERQAPSLWWTAPLPASAKHESMQAALAVRQRAAPVRMAAAGRSNGHQGRAKPAKASAAAGMPVSDAGQASQVSAPKQSCAALAGGAVMSVADLEDWLAGPPPEAAEEGCAASQAPVQRPKRKPKAVEVRSLQSRDIRLRRFGADLLAARCCSLSGLLAGLLGTLSCICTTHVIK